MASSAVRGTSLRAGGACVRCRKGKTKCVYENGRAPCKNCAKGMHECYLPSESHAMHHGQSPARIPRPRESLPGERSVSAASERPPAASSVLQSRAATSANEKIVPELVTECERILNKTLPSCVAFHKPSFLQKLKASQLEPSIVHGLLTIASRSSPVLSRRYGGHGGPTAAADHFAAKAISQVMQTLDNSSLADMQAMCLLVIHEWGCRNALRAYIYLGQVARMAQMYRIVTHHQPLGEAAQFIRDESFRRTVWLIYILDCFLSNPGRQSALSSRDIEGMALPCPDMSFHFGTPVYVRTLSGAPPRGLPDPATPLTEVGELGHLVMATKAWRDVVEMLSTTTVETFSDERCVELDTEIDAIRAALPMHFMDKPGHINLHITMGSGYTYAMLHCLLHCVTVLINRRRLLQIITTDGFDHETWQQTAPQSHLQIVDRVFASSHSIVALMLALEASSEKDAITCFPLVMLFACFAAASTVAWFSLKGLLPPDVDESAQAVVNDAMRFLQDGAEAWTLAVPWWRHLIVMSKVLRNGGNSVNKQTAQEEVATAYSGNGSGSSAGDQADAMDYERHPSAQPPDQADGTGTDQPRRPGFTTINGGYAGTSTSAPGSPPHVPTPVGPTKAESPNAPSSTGGQVPDAVASNTLSDMSAAELCSAFEGQLLELDDLAAFLGGGV